MRWQNCFWHGWRDYVDLPNYEKQELCSVEILDDSSNVVRTIDGITESSYEYSESNQIEDFGSVQSSLKIRIYEISSAVGRGLPAEGSV